MKTVKYKQGDVLRWVYNEFSIVVVLLERWDRKPRQRTAWMVRENQTDKKPFAVLMGGLLIQNHLFS
mgnify:CR=1 FL=1